MKPKTTLGQTAEIILPEISLTHLNARVDTGAKTSAIWVSEVTEVAGGLEVLFFGEGVPHFRPQTAMFKDYGDTIVTSSNGSSEARFKVKLTCRVAGRSIRAWFTLADRSTLTYPVLLGRNLLRGKFIVDVSLATTKLPPPPAPAKASAAQHQENIV
ncbi:MAG: RimK/LysX family protein [Candidatus Saccharibacteria bacterium]